jgi:hypothetical protein
MSDKQIEHNINESADKYEAKAKLVRGSDTRDQDKIDLRAKGDDPEAVVDDLHTMIQAAEDAADDARNIQPEIEEDEDEDEDEGDGDGE